MESVLQDLDLYLVSHGGVSSNYLTRYLEQKKLRVFASEKNNLIHAQRLVHFPIKLDEKIPCLFIYGDYINAIISQYNRGLLFNNMNKIHLGLDDHVNRVHRLIELFPDDPVGIKSQVKRFSLYTHTVFLRFPYSQEDVQNALCKLNIFIDTSDMMIQSRKTHMTFDDIQDPVLKKICKPYIHFDFSF